MRDYGFHGHTNRSLDACNAPDFWRWDELAAEPARVHCPNGCYGRYDTGSRGEAIPVYCGQNGCTEDQPGLAYSPDAQTTTARAAAGGE